MTNDEKNKIALFRYGIISELITGIDQYDSKDAYFKAKSEIEWIDPNGNKVKVNEKTIERWYYDYIKYGFEALKPKGRNDKGRVRKLDDDIMTVINHYVENHPRMPATVIYSELYYSIRCKSSNNYKVCIKAKKG